MIGSCRWLTCVYRSSLLSDPFERCDTFSFLELISDSDKDDSFSLNKPSRPKRSVDTAISDTKSCTSDEKKDED